MVDPVDLRFRSTPDAAARSSARADSRSVPNGFSMMTRRQSPSSSFSSPASRQALDDRAEAARRRRPGRTARCRRCRSRSSTFFSPLRERGVELRARSKSPAIWVRRDARQSQVSRIERLDAGPLPPVSETKARTPSARCARKSSSDHLCGRPRPREPVGQQARPRQVVERRHQQPLGQVAAGAEDHQRARRRRGARAAAGRSRIRAAALHVPYRLRRPPGARRTGCASPTGSSRRSVVLPRAEARVERGRQHVGRHRLLDRRLDRPAAFAGIVDAAGEFPRSGSSASAIAVRSSSQEETTLPRRQTSAMSARSSW